MAEQLAHSPSLFHSESKGLLIVAAVGQAQRPVNKVWYGSLHHDADHADNDLAGQVLSVAELRTA